MTDALNKLIEAVEAGSLHEQELGGMPMCTAAYPVICGDNWNCGKWSDRNCLAAYHGDLNAAKALHEALIPGAHWHLDENEDRGYVAGVFFGNWHEGVAKTPARAWLLAILRAYAAQQEATP